MSFKLALPVLLHLREHYGDADEQQAHRWVYANPPQGARRLP